MRLIENDSIRKDDVRMDYRQKPIDYLKRYIGIKEGSNEHKAILKVFNDSKLCKRYTMSVYDSWCAASASAAFIASGLTSIFPCVECSCTSMIKKAKNAGIWVENDAYVPSKGDVILYSWKDSGKGDCTLNPDHVGIVVSVTNRAIKVIEGNKKGPNGYDTVSYRELAVNCKYIRGFIVPKYPTNTTKPSKKSIETIAKEVLAGKWGNGEERKKKLTAAGYDYAVVQKRVTALSKKTAAPSKRPIETIAKEVIAGKWGSGADRKKKLTAAGYDYDIIQKLVNNMLKK